MDAEIEDIQTKKNDALIAACKHDDLERATRLLLSSADPNYTLYGETVMSFALDSYKRCELSILLLTYGADPNGLIHKSTAKDNYSLSAFHCIIRSHHTTPVLEFFISKGAKVDEKGKIFQEKEVIVEHPLHSALPHKFDTLNLLLKAGAKVDAKRTHKGWGEQGYQWDTEETAFHIMCNNYYDTKHIKQKEEIFNVLKLLLQYKADVNAEQKYLDNRPSRRRGYEAIQVRATALHQAFLRKQTGLVWFLISNGARMDIDYCYDNILTPSQVMAEDNYRYTIDNFPISVALAQLWSPELHKWFPTEVKKAIKCILLIAKRENWKFDKQILFTIISFVAYKFSYVKIDK